MGPEKLPFSKIEAEIQTTQYEREAYNRHYKLLFEWNNSAFLVSKKVLQNPFSSQYVDCIYISDCLFSHRNELQVFDLGSGAGFPGLIFAIRYREIKIKLFERNERKRQFLALAISNFGLSNVDLEKSIPPRLSRGIFFARAFLPISKLLSFVEQRAEQGSRVVINMGGQGKKLEKHKNFKSIDLRQYELPANEGYRRVEILEFVSRGT